MMDIVVVGIIGEDELAGVPPQLVAGMIIDRLHGAECEEEDGLADTHAARLLHDQGAKRIEDETLEGMVVERTESVGDVEAVVNGVDVAVEEPGCVEEAVHEVLPGVHEEAVGFI